MFSVMYYEIDSMPQSAVLLSGLLTILTLTIQLPANLTNLVALAICYLMLEVLLLLNTDDGVLE